MHMHTYLSLFHLHVETTRSHNAEGHNPCLFIHLLVCLSLFTEGFSSARFLLSLTYTELLVYECATLSSDSLLGICRKIVKSDC
jgi:hypothetical protein